MVDGHDDEQSREDQQCQCSRHDCLSAQTFGPEEEGEANRNDGATEQHEPNDAGNSTGCFDEPCPTGLGDEIELPQNFGEHRAASLIDWLIGKNDGVQAAERTCRCWTSSTFFHREP